jgi:hypothetical protein
MEYTKNGVPMFDGQSGLEYEIWSSSTKVFLKAQGYDIWKSIVKGYDSSKREKTAAKKELKKKTKLQWISFWKDI